MNTAAGRGKMFMVSKQMRKDRRDVEGTNFIKSDTGEIKIEATEVCGRWREYFVVLLNGENESKFYGVDAVEGPLYKITEQEVERALKGMKNDRAAGPSGLTSDMLKYVGRTCALKLLRVFQKILRNGTVPREWCDSLTIAVYKGKGDALQYGKYRGLRLLEHGMKIWERVLYERLKRVTEADENQFGFIAGRSTMGAIFVIQQL